MKKTFKEINKFLANTALKLTTAEVNSTCIFLVHQPKLPKGADKLRKF